MLYSSLSSLGAASGLDLQGRQINHAACFATFNVPGPAPVPIPPQNLTLNTDCNAVDAGVVLPNINDGFAGAAPDLGAHEVGLPPIMYGPRSAQIPSAPANLRISE